MVHLNRVRDHPSDRPRQVLQDPERRIKRVVETRGLEPLTSSVQGRRSPS